MKETEGLFQNNIVSIDLENLLDYDLLEEIQKRGFIIKWMSFVEGIADLIYGNPKKYLTAYKELIESKEDMK